MKLAIVGNGAIGNLVVLKSYLQHQDFAVISRTKQTFTLAATDIHQQKHNIPISLIDYRPLHDVNIIILPVKAYQIVTAVTELKPHMNNDQTLVLLHNGMGVIEAVKALLPQNPIIAATTSHAAYKPNMHSLVETGLGACHLGYVANENEITAHQCNALLTALLAPCTWHTNIEQALWDKLAVNAVINPLTAIHKIKNGQLALGQYQSIITDICRETANVINASGFNADDRVLVHNVMQIVNATSENYSSMYQDINHQRPSEIAFINGYICQEAKKQALKVPVNQDLFERIRALEEYN
ncbi:MAG: 2-dehydropantoate 2-reductase [Paraglaciecola polaris]|uniref:ketopantoate reductase family protein n=1 Tax=Paraglaciecola polaris TaxID=222814 RepID=UPI0030024C3E